MYDELKTNLLIEQKGVYNIWNIQKMDILFLVLSV
ncbi:hypothetical protein HMPREF1015_00648 [Bacillus smithii 7_3_47FAA]|uniref:Uncharacterized protein n=1 Tax=Bacillus smithii 7_3_47FAA TaxID=665952 RepID=G9QM81_9BACI|nr:hypothetical protein HMPREF1015_00648 [Bacillus smithii 7_3_47FAA]